MHPGRTKCAGEARCCGGTKVPHPRWDPPRWDPPMLGPPALSRARTSTCSGCPRGGAELGGDAAGGVGALSPLGHGCCIRVNGRWGAGGTQEATPKSSCRERAEAGRRFGGLGHVPAAPWRMMALGCHGAGPQSRDPPGAGPRSGAQPDAGSTVAGLGPPPAVC